MTRTNNIYRKNAGKIIITILLAALAFIVLYPFIWMLVTSFKPEAEIVSYPPKLFSGRFSLDSYINIWKRVPFLKYYRNTIIFSTAVTVTSLVFDTIAFGIFMMRSFFISLPKGLEEAGRIDGCTEFGIFRKIMVPLCKPAIVSLFIFHFMYQWNDLLYPLLLTTDDNMKTLPSGLATFMGTHVVEYGIIMAGACLSLLPILIAYFIAQKQFVQGIAMTGMKG